MPDALDLMVRSLRVGHPMNAAVGIVAREMMDPLGTEFGLIADEATYGMPITDALDRMAARVPVPDLKFLAIAINIQSTSGGNLKDAATYEHIRPEQVGNRQRVLVIPGAHFGVEHVSCPIQWRYKSIRG